MTTYERSPSEDLEIRYRSDEEDAMRRVAENFTQKVIKDAICQHHSPGSGARRVVATGNWGCGAYGGDPQLKCLLQWVAASQAKCPGVEYYSAGNLAMSQVSISSVL